ncbi:MAG: coproporphyrinogen III oxidase family protein [Deltaproteobacteria bacterium]|nr:coproporphyrinogen III oxidase family protein [Deltaproteobacteria bacterium]MDQ3298869.1 coproporphyrinogen III oxidase family protein [Myxococcota bacterium]
MADLGVYVHFPWCRKLCPYCDFAVEVGEPPHVRYRDAVLAELESRAASFTGELISIYLGGGTPSLWQPDCIAAVIAGIRARFATPRSASLEITIEANPTDCTDANLAAWRAAGIGRISIGVQSFEQDELVMLGRDHRFGDGATAIERVVAHGGFTVSADFILGVPTRAGRTPPWLEAVARLPVDHLSIYELTIEDRTAFGQRVRDGRLLPLDDDTLTDLYTTTHEVLGAAGFEHYEISSYARPGKRAVHNSLYWQGAAFLGLGVGAASLELASDGNGSGRRVTNPRKAVAYLAAPGVAAESTSIGAAEMACDRAWLGLRTADGVLETSLDAAPGIADWLVTESLAERRNGRICPSLRGFLMADRIAARIVQTWGDGDRACL